MTHHLGGAAFDPEDTTSELLRTLSHQTPDRVPTVLWSSLYGVTYSLYFDAITPFVQRLIEIGADVVHPVEPLHASLEHIEKIEATQRSQRLQRYTENNKGRTA